ncbi:unnamed protein product [Rotaria socialis]|uniref:Uncharacterized protein n=1 Tax=Rotaria socialis TaxID=392032 RepID=A0A817NBH0_9BILA|nr:unnamed protein product [Rotaria socialis]CAF3379615.1 unnamed protein product [Rotaria socialis]CAF3405832.1 unnamed protein product [Rotaria socialis]CAF3450660.1 unnamed protein product [Rotaria socialis]CAF3582512.1 unnamed protein product [Rotaria socialis]
MATTYRSREPVRLDTSSRIVPSNDYYQMNDQQIKARQQMAHVNVVVTQPGRNVWEFEHPWSTTLFSCCTNMKQCCFAFFCPCCFEYQVYKRAGETGCTCLCPAARFALRSKIRTAFRIEGDLCNDCCISTFCPCCTTIQLNRELYYQGL